MAYDGWIEYNGVEVVNLSRTVQLAQVLGIDVVRTTPESVAWIQTALSGVGYNDISNAPWYDEGYPPSTEFAGVVPLSFAGLDDSTMESTPVEYITDGGHSGKPRNATLAIVANVALVASTTRGADFGKRWLDRVFRSGGDARVFCTGADLRYFRWADETSPIAHRRDVRQTRGSSVTRKRSTDCSATWIETFTLTAADPFEYSDPIEVLSDLGSVDGPPGFGEVPFGTGPFGGYAVTAQGQTALVQSECPVYDYTPIYDPLYPALVPSPTAPDFFPEGWGIVDGATFDRFWARIESVEPTFLDLVPMITLTTTVEARMVRVSIWPNSSDIDDQCDPLFSVVVSYLPAGVNFIVDGEQKASYVWDGFSPAVRRTDSLVYSPDARPVQWTAFNDPEGLMVTLDIFSDSSGVEGDGQVRADLSFVQKSN